MANVFIDGKTYEVDSEDNMLHVALSLGFDLPYFCWHPAMGSVGACRQCAVKQFKDETDTRGRIVMACMTPAAEGTRISIYDSQAAEFRASVIEWLMLNHPHDCPVCDEGSECHLQDMTVMTGHVVRRDRFDKRTHRNQYLGPFINHEMNRCIQCYRCVRFYRDYAGGRDFDVFAAHDHVYFGRHEDGVLENEFSGNLVEVCPTGVFTDKSLKHHYTRKWDLQTAPSICVHCGLGCNTIPGERYGTLRRIRNRYNDQINGYFLCDRGRYGYEFVDHPQRIRTPRSSTELPSQPLTTVMPRLEEILKPETPLIGIGSPRASLEANFALRRLVGADHFFPGISANEARLYQRVLSILQEGPVPAASLQEAEQSDAVIVLGEDVTNTAPRLALALRQSVRNQPLQRAIQKKIDPWNDAALRELIQEEKGPLYIVTPAGTPLDDVATSTIHLAPDDIARLGFALAHEIDSSAPEVSGLPEELTSLIREIVEKLKDAKKPLVVSGTSLGSEAVIQAAANLAWALNSINNETRLLLTVPECNSLGLALLDTKDVEGAWRTLEKNPSSTLVILENDLYRRADSKFVDELLNRAQHLIVIDSLENAMTARADVALPAATFAEGDGTLVNNEGRAQRYFQVFVPQGEIMESWRWVSALMRLRNHEFVDKWNELDEILQDLSADNPLFAPILEIAPPEDFRIMGQKIPRQPHRYSGRTAMHANISVHEPKPPDDPDAPLKFSMEGYKGLPPPSLIPRFWAPGWNSVQSLNKFQAEVDGPLIGGNPGQRLIEPRQGKQTSYYQDVPEAFTSQTDQYLALPLYHIFGSEELSRLSPPVAERIPQAYVAMPPELAQKLGAVEGQEIQVTSKGRSLRLPLHLNVSLAANVVGMPAGFPDVPMTLPAWVHLVPETAEKGA